MRAARRVLVGLALSASLAITACGAPAPGPTASPVIGPAPSEPVPSEPAATGPAPTGPAQSGPAPSETPAAPEMPAAPSPSRPSAPADPEPAPPPPGAPSASTPAPPPVPPGSTGLPAAWRGVDLERVATERRVVALTFDGGSSDEGVAGILATLAEHDVPATFFVTGAFARRYPAQVRAMTAAGPVGNHSDTHLAYPDLTDVRIRADLAAAEASIAAAGGGTALPLFRFPFGARTEHDIRVVNDAGYLPVRWSVDSLGWKGTSGGLSAEEVVDRVARAAVPGLIVLMHVGANPDDGTTLDADALPGIIERLRALGFGFVDLGDLVR